MRKSTAGREKPSPGRSEVQASAMLAVNLYLTRYLGRLHQAFDGDLSEAMVLGEIAHHNVSGMLADVGGLTHLREAVASGRLDRRAYLPTNAFSIAQVTGIPRQTVRRKVASLIKRGWLRATPAGLVVTGAPFEHFRDFNRVNIADFLETAQALLGFLSEPAGRR